MVSSEGGGVNHISSSIHSADDDVSDPPGIVVYLVEPFTLASDSPELQRLACVALLKSYNTVIANVPDNIRSNLSLQVMESADLILYGSE